MDLKALLTKLDKINDKQVLLESTSAADQLLTKELEVLKESYVALMERLHYKEIMDTRSIKDEQERKQKLAHLARQNDYPGLFDPVTGKWVDTNGEWAWFGAYQKEVERMEDHGLIPPAARTSALLGLMGKDETSAKKASGYVSDIDSMVDQSGELIDKALVSKRTVGQSDATVVHENNLRGTIAQSLVESFGYEFKQIAEAITRDEHKQLKNNIEKLKGFKGDPEVEKEVHILLDKYNEFVKYRSVLIAQIQDAISKLKALRAKPLKENREELREEIYIITNKETDKTAGLFLYYDSDDNLVQYSINEDIGKDLSDVGRGFAAGITLGYADNVVAYMLSKYKGTTYGEELVRQLKKTEQAKKDSPVLYRVGQFAGGMSIPIPGGGGVVANLVKGGAAVGAELALDKFHRTQHNASYEAGEIKRKRDAIIALQQAIKQKDPKANVGAEGELTPELVALAKKHGVALPTGIKPTPAKPASNTSAPASTVPAAAVTPQAAAVASAPAVAATVIANQDGGVSTELMNKLGAKTPKEALAKFTQMAKGKDAGEVLAQLLGIKADVPAVATESIIFSSMTENERMAYLRDRLAQLDESKGSETIGFFLRALEKIGIMTAERKALLALEKTFGKDAGEVVLKSGERWTPATGSEGKYWINEKGVRTDVESLNGLVQKDIASGWKPPVKSTEAPPVAPKPAEPAPVKSAERPAAANDPKFVQAAEKAEAKALKTKFSEKYPKMAAVLGKTGSALKYGWSKKWWLAMAALMTWGYLGNDDFDDGVENTPAVTPPAVTPVDPNSDQKVDTDPNSPANIRRREEEQIKSVLEALLKQLEAMYPDDLETRQIADEVRELIGAKSNTGSSGSDQKVDKPAGKVVDNPLTRPSPFGYGKPL